MLENDSDIVGANSWYEVHDGDVFEFKQSVCEYLSKAKELHSAELNSLPQASLIAQGSLIALDTQICLQFHLNQN